MSTPSGMELVGVVLARLGNHSYEGGVNGTCLDCPFSEGPLRRDGTAAPYAEVSNDPTEAYFRCSLPGRERPSDVEWGEYAPCEEKEWADAALAALAQPAGGGELRRAWQAFLGALTYVAEGKPAGVRRAFEEMEAAVARADPPLAEAR